MKSVAALVTLLAVASALHPRLAQDPEVELWQLWKSQFDRSYESTAEEVTRFTIWKENAKIVKEHNLRADMEMTSFHLELNDFADMTNEEYVASRLSPVRIQPAASSQDILHPLSERVPETEDWRPKGYVTPIKNQKQCGSCWAFSATGSLEGQHFNVTGDLISLSEQQLVDCDTKCYGCDGGLSTYAFEYWQKTHPYGANLESAYPYKARNGNCKTDGKQVVAKVSGYKKVRSGSETDLKDAAGTIGPISVAIDASHNSFQLYKSGVYYEPKCKNGRFGLDHAVLVVGYNSDRGQDYWLVKNSWGKSWGQEGYIWMSRNRNNNCGIATDASYPIAKA